MVVSLLCGRGQLLLGRGMQRRMIYSIDGVFESHLKEDTVLQVEKHWKPRLANTIPKVLNWYN